MKLGARILKTGIAIILALFITSFLPNDVGFKSVAGISAVVAMQPNIHRSVKTISEQAMGNFIGALLAVIVVVVFGKNIVIMGITVILLIAILYKINLAHVATLASVTALIIMGQHTGSFYVAATFRFILVMIGVLSASIVNLIFLPPKFETKIYHYSVKLTSDIFVWFRLVLNDTSDYHQIKQDNDQIKTRLNRLEQIYDYYNEERPLTKKHVFQQNRKKILFKEVVSTTRQAYEVLNRMTRYQNDLHNLNYNLIFQIKLEIDALIEYHEQILRSLSKKARYNIEHVENNIINPQKKDLMLAFQQELIQNPYQTKYSYSNLMQIIAAIEEYRYHLEHLNRLRLSYFTYHRTDADIDIVDEDFDV